uniref:Uncharacterized protein n=1 Tax=Arundo donax TaxID=35708 RepID=A0A0A9S5Q8_ARUDO
MTNELQKEQATSYCYLLAN